MGIEDDIAEIKKEIVESHNLVIKTDNLIKNLSSEIRQIEKKQERYERKYIFNSVAAYVIFVVTIFGGMYVAFDAKVGVVRRENEELQKQLSKTKAEAEEVQSKLSLRSQQEKTTERFLRLQQEGRDREALKELESLDANLLSPALARLVGKEGDELKRKLGEALLETGRGLFQKGLLEKALSEFNRVLELRAPMELVAKAQFQRGGVLSKLNKNTQAGEAYLAAADADPKSPQADTALFYAAGALESAGNADRAAITYDRLAKEFPESPLAAQARRRAQNLSPQKPAPQSPHRPSTPQPDARPRETPPVKPAPTDAAQPAAEPAAHPDNQGQPPPED